MYATNGLREEPAVRSGTRNRELFVFKQRESG
jgi:hypothetical protein